MLNFKRINAVNNTYKALWVEELEDKTFSRSIQEKEIPVLAENHLLIKVHYSSLNYKDALSASGHKGITRKFPHIPGIDASGIVAQSNSPQFKVGDEVLVTGYDMGMNTKGGFSEYIHVPADWAVNLPEGMSLRETMIYGTAGFTAASGIMDILEQGIRPEMGKVLVTGSTGGVGTMAVAMLSKLGFEVTASTGKVSSHDLLKKIGASEIISREDVNDQSGKGLLSKRWIAAVDTVGGNTLATVLKSTADRGVVTNCGMVESPEFQLTVYPFILRAVKLFGIASAETPMPRRLAVWEKIRTDLRLGDIEFMLKEVSLQQLNSEIDLILKGGQIGRVILNMNK